MVFVLVVAVVAAVIGCGGRIDNACSCLSGAGGSCSSMVMGIGIDFERW